MKNERVRTAMLRAGLTQAQLAELLDIQCSELSVMLKYELARKEQDQIVAIIRTCDTQRT